MKQKIIISLLFLCLNKGSFSMQKPENKTLPKVQTGIYEHYKGMRYKVLMVAWNSEGDELEPWVVYQGLYTDPTLGDNPIFMRSLDKFLENVVIDNKEQPRFRFIKVDES